MSKTQSAPQTADELNNAEKIFVLLLRSDNSKEIPGNLWLQKEVFVISQKIESLNEYLDFGPHLQGPFSETVNNIAENLEYHGIVERDRRGLTLTDHGKDVADYIAEGSSDEILELISDVKKRLNDLSKDELLVYIYYTYPDMTTKSLEKSNLEKVRESAAKSLYTRDKVDLDKAADLAGMSKSKFRDKAI